MPFSQRPHPEHPSSWDTDIRDPDEEYAPDPRPNGLSALGKGIIGFLIVFILLGGLTGVVLLVWNASEDRGPGLAPVLAREGGPGQQGNPGLLRDNPPARVPQGTLEHVKAATVYIKVESDDYLACGSGFVMKADGDTVWIITNDHVVSPPPERRFGLPRPPRFGPPRFGPGGLPGGFRRFGGQLIQYTAVFHSGTPQEKSYPAEVVGSTKDPDLAVLRLRGVTQPPQPLDLGQGFEVRELMDVLYFGFPFGQDLALDRANPAVSVGRGTVASLRRNTQGRVSVVQIDGDLNPGNSGGPLVDSQGRLVGIVFAKVRDTRIGLAVHAGELDEVLRPRIGPPALVSQSINGVSECRVEVGVSDPLDTLPELQLLYKLGDLPEGLDNGPLPNAERITLLRQGLKAVGVLRGEAMKLTKSRFAYQFAYSDGDKETRYTKPRLFAPTQPPQAAKEDPSRPGGGVPVQPREWPAPAQRSGRDQPTARKIGKLIAPQQLSGLLAHWSFDEGTGEVAKDVSGKGHDANLHDTTWVEGVSGKALRFNGKSSYADFGKSPELNFATRAEFTFSVWVKTTAREGTILSLRRKSNGAPVIDLHLEFTGRLKAEIRDDTTEAKMALTLRGPVVNDDNWHHIALVRQENGVCLLTVDSGQPVKHMFPPEHLQFHFATQGPITTDLRALGCERYWVLNGRSFGSAYYSGCLDEACLFSRALTQGELKKLAGAGD